MKENQEIKVTIEIDGVEHVSTPDPDAQFSCLDCSLLGQCVIRHTSLYGACFWLNGQYHFELKKDGKDESK